MTLLFLGLCLVFGFFAFRHFSNGRFIWGAFAALGCLLMAGAVWVDYQRAGDAAGKAGQASSSSASSPSSASPADAVQPVIADYNAAANELAEMEDKPSDAAEPAE